MCARRLSQRAGGHIGSPSPEPQDDHLNADNADNATSVEAI